MCVCVYSMCLSGLVSHHKGNDAPLRRLPLKAALDVCAVADQDHDASLHAVKILLEQLHTRTDRQTTSIRLRFMW